MGIFVYPKRLSGVHTLFSGVSTHVLCVRGIDYTIPRELGVCEVGGVGYPFAWIIGEISANDYSDSICIIFLGAIISNNSCVYLIKTCPPKICLSRETVLICLFILFDIHSF